MSIFPIRNRLHCLFCRKTGHWEPRTKFSAYQIRGMRTTDKKYAMPDRINCWSWSAQSLHCKVCMRYVTAQQTNIYLLRCKVHPLHAFYGDDMHVGIAQILWRKRAYPSDPGNPFLTLPGAHHGHIARELEPKPNLNHAILGVEANSSCNRDWTIRSDKGHERKWWVDQVI